MHHYDISPEVRAQLAAGLRAIYPTTEGADWDHRQALLRFADRIEAGDTAFFEELKPEHWREDAAHCRRRAAIPREGWSAQLNAEESALWQAEARMSDAKARLMEAHDAYLRTVCRPAK